MLLCPWDFQASTLEWVAISFSRGSSRPRDQTCISSVFCIGRQILYHSARCKSLLPNHIANKGWSQHLDLGLPDSRASLLAQRLRIRLQCGRPGFDAWVGKIPCRRERQLTPLFWPRDFHGPWSLVGHRLHGVEPMGGRGVHGVTKSQTRLSDFHFHFADSKDLLLTTYLYCLS